MKSSKLFDYNQWLPDLDFSDFSFVDRLIIVNHVISCHQQVFRLSKVGDR